MSESPTRVLVLGTGQLGLMLAAAGARLGISVDRICPDTGKLHIGTSGWAMPSSYVDQYFDASEYDAITIEREHLPASPLVDSLRQQPAFANNTALNQLADRLPQKSLYDSLELPTAAWLAFDQDETSQDAIDQLGFPLVFKRRTGGYDGRGLCIAKQKPDIPRDWAGAAIVEKHMPFHREVSLVGARNASGETVFYPLVENHHKDGILRLSLAPAADSTALQQQAENIMRPLMEALDYRGVMAVEFFQVDGKLYINEVAPRVHNSGHWTQDGADICQFELHLRALTNLHLPVPAYSSSAMVNLIGVEFEQSIRWSEGHRFHWYGKTPRPARKVGHINVCTNQAHKQAYALLDSMQIKLDD